MDISKLLGEKIVYLRKQRGMSQEQLALKAEVNKSFMGQIERGQHSPTVKTLEKITHALNVSFQELFSFETTSLLLDEMNDSSNANLQESETLGKINMALQSRTKKEQEAFYKLMKLFFTLVDKDFK